MSRAPIISGMQEVPERSPTRIGMTTKKIMIVACMVNSHVVGLGLEDAADIVGSGTQPRPGTGRLGPGELPAHEQREQAAQDHHEEPHEQELPRRSSCDRSRRCTCRMKPSSWWLGVHVVRVSGRAGCAHLLAFSSRSSGSSRSAAGAAARPSSSRRPTCRTPRACARRSSPSCPSGRSRTARRTATRTCPGLVASNHARISRPGTASCLKRNCGTKKLWMTSWDFRMTRIDLVDRHVHLVEQHLVVVGAELPVGAGIGRPPS